MYLSVEEIISDSKKELETGLRLVADSDLGKLCDAINGFVHTAVEWKKAANQAFGEELFDEVATNKFAARAASLSVLTNATIEIASDIVRSVQAGSSKSAFALWRALAEAKNNALLIDLDVSGTAGFLWLHYGVINGAKADPRNEDLKWAAEAAKNYLLTAGFRYDGKSRDPWAKGIDGKTYGNALLRSEYIARYRKLPAEIPREHLEMLSAAEQEMIRMSNAVAHPILFRGTINVPLPAIILASIIDPMAVMLAYKVAASELQGWPQYPTVGEQFTIYPVENQEARVLSDAVVAMHFHCVAICRKLFQVEENLE